jgi:RNA:NAD 2'-phosphotransferase (TPT1/KptA family)
MSQTYAINNRFRHKTQEQKAPLIYNGFLAAVKAAIERAADKARAMTRQGLEAAANTAPAG